MCRLVASCRVCSSFNLCGMANILGRNDRRRRVLNEEALSASTAHLALRRGDVELAAAKTQRYSEQAGVEHHPQITDFLPRRFSTPEKKTSYCEQR